MDDLISKKSVLEGLNKLGRDNFNLGSGFEHYLDALEDSEKQIKALPSAERKTGRWLVMETAYEDTVAKCSECGFETLVNEPGNGLHMVSELCYCPRCGAKMSNEVTE